MAAAGVALADTPTVTSLPGDAARGAVLYRTGTVGGSPVPAMRPGVGALPAPSAACVTCHRPSALGGTEAGVRVPPVSAELLFAPGQPPVQNPRMARQWLRHQTRSAYTPDLLARALRDGLDSDGRPLAGAMPRYRLDDQAVADLIAFLATRRRAATAGIEGQTMHLATVVTPQATPERRDAVLQAMAAWSHQMGWGPLKVQWHVWRLQGEPATWPDQLSALWQARPVYALLSGAGGADWSPVEALCEARQVPCLFPVIDRVPDRSGQPGRHWSMYLGGGVEAEAGLLAQRLAQLSAVRRAGVRVWQLADSATGQAAAAALCARLRALQPPVSCQSPAPPQNLDHQGLGPEDLLVLWLSPQGVQRWLADRAAPPAASPSHRLVLSGQLAPPLATPVPMAWRRQVLWLSQRADPMRQAAGAALSLVPWMQRLQLSDGLDAAALADVHAGTFFFSDALAQAQGVHQPDYLLERLEVAVDQRPAGAAYFRLSLGPGQRIAAQGGHLLAFRPPDHEQLAPLPGYLRAGD